MTELLPIPARCHRSCDRRTAGPEISHKIDLSRGEESVPRRGNQVHCKIPSITGVRLSMMLTFSLVLATPK